MPETSIERFLGDQVRRLQLTSRMFEELHRTTRKGALALYGAVLNREASHRDLTEIVRCALIGGGTSLRKPLRLSRSISTRRRSCRCSHWCWKSSTPPSKALEPALPPRSSCNRHRVGRMERSPEHLSDVGRHHAAQPRRGGPREPPRSQASFGVDDAGAITGTAWPFGTPDRVGDMIEKGAFAGAVLPRPCSSATTRTSRVGIWEAAVETEAGPEVRGRLRHRRRCPCSGGSRRLCSLALSPASPSASASLKAAPRTSRGRTISALDLAEISSSPSPASPRTSAHCQVRRRSNRACRSDPPRRVGASNSLHERAPHDLPRLRPA